MTAQTNAASPRTYVVLVNDEAEYSIWPTNKPLPNGWRDAGRTGTRSECLAYVDEVSADEPAGAAEAAEFVEPVTAAERQACAVVAEVLGIERVGVNDNFFVRGGTSLLAIRLLEKLRAVGLQVSPKDVFEAGDVGELARRLQPLRKLHEAQPNKIPPDAQRITPEMLTLVALDQDSIDEIVALVPGGASNVQDIYPLTPLQEGFVFQHLASEVDPYLTSLVLHFDAEQDLARFTRGLDEFVARHDILRTSVVWHIRPRPVQVVWRRATLSTHRRESVTTEEELLAIGAAQATGFDLQRAPLMRATEAPNPQGGWSLLLVLHHVIDDDVLLRNLASEFHARAAGRSLPAPAPFRNFVSYLSSRDPKASESFWREQLEGLRESTNPIRGRRARPATRGSVLGRDLTERVRETSRACAVVPAALMHLAYAVVLARRGGTDDVVFGTVLNGRSAPVVGLEATAGMFLSTLPVRVRLDQGSVRGALSRMHALLAELPAHDHVPLPMIQSWSSIPPSAPLFSALLNTRHATDDGTDRLFHGDLGVRDGRAGEATHYPFALSINDVADGYQLVLQTVADDGEAVLARFEQVLACIVADVEQPVTAVLPGTALEASVRRSLAFWRSRLAGAPQAIDMPTDRARDGARSYQAGLMGFQVAPALEKKLAEFNVERDATPYVTLLSAFVALLYRYTHQEDMVIGSPVAPGQSGGALPLRLGVRGEDSFTALVQKVRETVLEALEHPVALEDLVREVGTDPLFQVTFALQPLRLEHTSAMFDLILTLGDEGEGLEGSVNYASALFDAGTAERLAKHYLALLESMLAEPERAIGEQPLISEDERRGLLEAGRGPVTELPSGSIAEVFESVVAGGPEAIAVVCANAEGRPSVTYGELNRRANQLARYLREASPTRLARVGIAMERSLASLVSTLAVLKAGAAYVPLDPHAPAERLRFIINDTDLDLILTDGAVGLDGGGRPTVDVRERGAAIDALPGEDLARHGGADDLAYIMYTSGSTGRPKGVCVRQRGVVRLVCNTNYFAGAGGLRFTHLSPTTFDAATFEIWGSLLNGATMVLLEGRQLSLDALAGALERERAEVVWLTTGLFKLLVEHRLDALKHVRYLATGGDVAPLAQVSKVLAALPGCTLVNGYGPTENTTFSTTFQVPAGHACTRPLPIGKPIANSSAFVVDARGELVPCGVVGELYVGGAGVAGGYWNQPELTAERFVTSPSLGAGPLYRTGDLARWRADGNLDFLGRADQQVKIRGFRIEPAEIEAVLAERAGVREVVVVAREDALGQRGLVAYCVAANDVSPGELRAVAEQYLPDYMIPAVFVTLPSLPLLPSGKVDRRALPAPDAARRTGAPAYVPPQSALEESIAAIWREVLHLERVGCTDNFSDLGGHSLNAMLMAARVRKELGVDVLLRDLLARPTIRQQADFFAAAGAGRTKRARSAQAAVAAPTPRQRRTYVLSELDAGTRYNRPRACHIDGELDVGGLEEALRALIRRHEVLRTSFEERDGGIVKLVHEEVPFSVGVAQPAREPEELVRPFDLSTAPLMRVELGARGGSAALLMVDVHRIAAEPALLADLDAVLAAHGLLPIQVGERSIDEGADAYERSYPLAPQQRQLWFLHELNGANSVYNMIAAVEVTGVIDAGAFASAVNQVISRHDGLRTTFELRDGGPVQIAHDTLQGVFSYDDLRALPASSRRDAAMAVVQQEAARTFDLVRGPLIRLRVSQTADDKAVVVSTMHHIVSDGWSVSLFLTELMEGYEAHARGAQPGHRALGAQYTDYVTWRAQLPVRQSLEFWKAKLAGAPQEIDLPTDRARDGARSHQGGLAGFQVAPTLEKRLAEFNVERDVTSYVTLLSAFVALLHRYTRQEDMVIGSPVANRQHGVFHGTMGYFVSTLPLRVSVRGEESFTDLVRRVREVVLDALEHQDVSLEEIVSELQPDREPGRNPLFQVMFALQNLPAVGAVKGLELQPLRLEHTSAMFDLILTLGDEGEGLEGSVNYASALFDAGTAERLAKHYLALLESMLAEPERAIGEQPLISEDERRGLLEAGRGPVTELPSGSIAEVFESVVAGGPEAIAVVCANAEGRPSVTYGELNRRANQLARYLREASPTRLARVGIAMERSLASLVSTLAVLKAGAAYVPLDPHAPAERLRFIINDTDLDLILTDGAVGLDGGGRPTVDVRERGAAIDALPGEDLARHGGADDLAYIMYTSGSTGRPKGVCVRQRGVVRLVCNTNYFAGAGGLRFTHLSPTTFDAATFEIWGSLLNGATMVLLEGRQLSLDALAGALERERAEVVWLTTGLFKLLVEHRLDALKHVRYLATGGDVAPLAQVSKVLAALPGCTLVNGYGPTENTTFSTTFQVPAGHACTRPLPIGKPIANSSAFVVDARGELVPCGVVGELYVGGAGVAGGYWNQPELTAERFVTSPSLGAGPLYRTGDLARWRADGNLDFLGRADQQVKIRGFRIEPAEIEAVLRQHARVTDAVVCVWQSSDDDPKRLVAYVVARSGATVGASELRSYLEQRVPEYMVPANYVFLEVLPLNAHQKVDRRALPPPDDSQVAFSAPATAEEALLCRIWAELLGLERLGTRDDFLERGGDSLLALQAAMRARKEGFEVDPDVFLRQRTVQASAPRMVRCALPPRTPSAADADGRSLPLSASQQAMLVHSLVSGAPDLYLQHIEVPLSGPVDAELMRDALATLVSRHPALRASFALDDEGIGHQRVHDDVQVAFSFADLSGLEPAARRQHLAVLREQDRRQGSVLSSPALVRFRLFKDAEDAYQLAIVHHHIVLDGWSLSILLKDLDDLYHARLLGRQEPRLAEPPPSIQSYAKWCAERATDALEAFWRAELAGFEEATTFDSVARTPEPGAAFDHQECHARLDSSEVRPLSLFATRHGLTLSTLFQGALAYVLSRLCGRDEVMFGVTVSGRHASCPQADERVGLLINTLPARTKLSPEASVLAWLSAQQHRLGLMREHGTVTQAQLRACSDLLPGAGPFKLFDCVLVFENFPAPVTSSGSRFEFGEMRFSVPLHLPVVIAVIPTGGTIRLQCSYDGRLFDEALAQQLLQALRHVVSEFVRCGSQGRLRDLRFPTVAETALLTRWNDTATAGPGDDVFDLVARRAGAQPEAVAIQAGSRRVTYAELHRDAEALARRLRHAGVQAGDRVGLHFERSPELVTAMLAVLRARACFVPLSTTEPMKRVDLKLADAAPALVLTSQALLGRLEGVECLCVDVAAPAVDTVLVAERAPVGADAPAYVIYTSGSTGAPKGVVVSRGALTNYSVAAADNFALTPGDRALQFASVTFDAFLEEVFPTLLAGATLVLRDDVSAADFHRFSELCVSNEISVVNLPTAFWEGWINEIDSLPECVRLVVIGGDAAAMASVSRWRKVASPQVRLLNTYGPTEGTIVATALDVGAWDATGFHGPSIPIGTPVANVQAWVCDPWGGPQPPGVPGELIIAGAGVAIGYLGDPQQTQAKFIASEPGAPFKGRAYRTGDRARWTRDGVLEFLGRFDDQVKVNGFRVEVREVEALLARHPNVKAAAVKAFRRGTAVSLVGYVAEHRRLEPAEYRAYLREHLPEYMCTSEIVSLAHLPMTSSGKVDKHSLAMPAARPGAAVSSRVGNDLEELTVSVFSDVLGTEVTLDADFFALGGTSILATLVASRLRKLVAMEVPVRWLLEHPTARGLARALSGARRGDGHLAHACAIPLKSRGDKAPVFFVPGVFGSVVYLSALARAFPEHRPLYALQAPGLDGGAPLTSIDALAEHYWHALRAIQPDGPYLLAGHSFGGTVAYALARRIVESGASVAHLFLVDGQAPTRSRWEEHRRADLLAEFATAFGEFLGVGAPVTAVEMDGLDDESALALVRRRLEEAGLAGGGVDLDTLRRFFAVFDANMRAPVGELDTPLAVHATLIKGAQSAARQVTNSSSYGWTERFSRELEVVTIPGDHFSILTAPLVRRLVDALEQRLRGAGAE
nr:non-ribosomal peptide synthetase [Myxococcus sp. AM009]